MATTYNFIDGTIDGAVRPADVTLHENRTRWLKTIVDFSLQNLDTGATDVGRVLNIPANTTVLTAYVRVMTAEAANGTCDLGYGGNTDQWGDGISLATADVIVGGLDAPVFFAAADTIDIIGTVDGADVDLTTAKIEVVAKVLKHVDSY